MNKNIMNFSSRKFYNTRLIAHEIVTNHTLKDITPFYSEKIDRLKLIDKPLIFVNTCDEDFREIRIKESTSLKNLGEAKVCIAVVDYLRNFYSSEFDNSSIGIITPYTDQMNLILELFTNPNNQKRYDNIEVNTVDGFQGREKEVIIISMVRSNDVGSIGFLSEKRRMNVAITRARRMLVLIGDSNTVSKDEFLKDLVIYFNLKSANLTVCQLLNKQELNLINNQNNHNYWENPNNRWYNNSMYNNFVYPQRFSNNVMFSFQNTFNPTTFHMKMVKDITQYYNYIKRMKNNNIVNINYYNGNENLLHSMNENLKYNRNIPGMTKKSENKENKNENVSYKERSYDGGIISAHYLSNSSSLETPKEAQSTSKTLSNNVKEAKVFTITNQHQEKSNKNSLNINNENKATTQCYTSPTCTKEKVEKEENNQIQPVATKIKNTDAQNFLHSLKLEPTKKQNQETIQNNQKITGCTIKKDQNKTVQVKEEKNVPKIAFNLNGSKKKVNNIIF